MVFVRRRDVNEIIGDLITLSGPEEVDLDIDWFITKNPDEALGILKFLRKVCKVVKVEESGHPLGRGWIYLSCPSDIRIRVHGDWKPERNYVKIEIE